VKEKPVALGNEPMDMNSAAFAKFVREKVDGNGRVIRAAGIKPQ
jgi:hypothetical protein